MSEDPEDVTEPAEDETPPPEPEEAPEAAEPKPEPEPGPEPPADEPEPPVLAKKQVEKPDKPPVTRPVRRPTPVRSERVARAAAKSGSGRLAPEPPTGSQKRVMEHLPRWFWLLLVAELTFVVVLFADIITGWGDAPENCSRSVCSLGQGVGIISFVAAVLLGIAVGASFMVLALGAAQGTRRAARQQRNRPE
jgi:hypothetical protein